MAFNLEKQIQFEIKDIVADATEEAKAFFAGRSESIPQNTRSVDAFERTAEVLEGALSFYEKKFNPDWNAFYNKLPDDAKPIADKYKPEPGMVIGIRPLMEFTGFNEYFCRNFIKYLIPYPYICYTYSERGRSKFKPRSFVRREPQDKFRLFFSKQRKFELPSDVESKLISRLKELNNDENSTNERIVRDLYIIGSIVEKMYLKETKSFEKPMHKLDKQEYVETFCLSSAEARAIIDLMKHCQIVTPAWKAVDMYYLTVTDEDKKDAENINNKDASDSKHEELKYIANGDKEAISIPEIDTARSIFDDMNKIHENYSAALTRYMQLINELQEREEKLKTDAKKFAVGMSQVHDLTQKNKELEEENKKYKVFKKTYDEAVDDCIAELNDKAKERIQKFVDTVRMNPQKVEINNFVEAFKDDLIGFNQAAKAALKKKTSNAIKSYSTAELKEILDEN